MKKDTYRPLAELVGELEQAGGLYHQKPVVRENYRGTVTMGKSSIIVEVGENTTEQQRQRVVQAALDLISDKDATIKRLRDRPAVLLTDFGEGNGAQVRFLKQKRTRRPASPPRLVIKESTWRLYGPRGRYRR